MLRWPALPRPLPVIVDSVRMRSDLAAFRTQPAIMPRAGRAGRAGRGRAGSGGAGGRSGVVGPGRRVSATSSGDGAQDVRAAWEPRRRVQHASPRHGHRDGGPRSRRQRVRRRGGGRVRLAGGGAAHVRAGRRGARRVRHRRRPDPARALRAGGCAAAGHHRAAARRAGPDRDPRHRAAPGHRPGSVGRLAHAPARPRHAIARRGPRPRSRVRGRGLSAGTAGVVGDRRGRAALP